METGGRGEVTGLLSFPFTNPIHNSFCTFNNGEMNQMFINKMSFEHLNVVLLQEM